MRSKIITSAVATSFLVIGVPGIDVGSGASAQNVVQADANGNNVFESQVTPNRGQGVGGERWTSTLVPAPVVAIGPGATNAELATLRAAFPPPAGGNAGWVINNPAAGAAPLPGTFTIVNYDAYEDGFLAPPEAPVDGDGVACDLEAVATPKDCVTIRYNNPNPIGGAEVNPVAPNVLRWVQFVCTSAPNVGAPCRPVAAGLPGAPGYLDLPPPPLPRAGPFYYTEAEHARFSGAANVPPLTFLDKPGRRFPLNRAGIDWGARLYLVEWNGTTPNPAAPGPNGNLTIRGGVKWGFALGCVNINQAVDRFLGGGADKDRPDTEFDGPEPSGMAPPACQASYIRSLYKYEFVLWVLLLVLVGAPLIWLYWRRRARARHSG
ncbi:MAG: hypothetical protein ACT4O2_00610 [Beijerinckiaceae bacterium]